MGSDHEIIPVVNKHDEIIGYKSRKDITHDDMYRVAACRVVDSEGNILLAQRGLTKKHHPGKWGPAVAGTVKQGESYLDNILKEIAEEIGIYVHPEELLLQEKICKDRDRKHFTQWYLLVYTGDKALLRPEPGAVEQLKWYTPEELRNAYTAHPELFLTSMEYILKYMNLI